jgi:hypothetical protein
MTDRWPMLQYVPIRGAFERAQFRVLRSSRKQMARIFKERGLLQFWSRMEDLRKNPRLNGAEKRLVFEGILNDYAKFVTEQQAPKTDGETPDSKDGGESAAVDLQSGASEVKDGSREDAAVGVPELAGGSRGVAE